MKAVREYDAHICLTVAGVLFHQGKVLLVKHKKLQIWLAPGGHIEENELPHLAAEREFWEETGLKVTAIQVNIGFAGDTVSEYVPNPVVTNLHWISKANYEARKAGKTAKKHGRACEQHICFIYLVEPAGSLEFKQNVEETDGIGWFTPEEVQNLETTADIKFEVKYLSSLADTLKV